MSQLTHFDNPSFHCEVLDQSNISQDDEDDNKEHKEADEERAETSSPEAEKSQNVEEEAATLAVQVRVIMMSMMTINYEIVTLI